MVGQKQVSVFSHVETAGGMGQVDIPVGESSCHDWIALTKRTHFLQSFGWVGDFYVLYCLIPNKCTMLMVFFSEE